MDSPCREGQGHLDLGKVDASGKLEEFSQLLTPLQALNIHQHRAGGVRHIRHVPETQSMIPTSFLLVGKHHKIYFAQINCHLKTIKCIFTSHH